MPKLTPAAVEIRRAKILHAARACFLAHGFLSTSVDQICAEAGISKGAFYGYFASKDSIIEALVSSSDKGLDDLVEVEDLQELRLRMIAMITPSSAVGRLEIEVWGYCLRDPLFRERIARSSEHLLQAITDVLERLKRAQQVHLSVAPAMGARLLVTFLMGAVAQGAINEMSEDELDAALSALMKSIQLR